MSKKENFKRENRNVKLIAEGEFDKDSFDIYLDLSGERHYLMTHRKNNGILKILKEKKSLEEFRRLIDKKKSKISNKYNRYGKERCNKLGYSGSRNKSRKQENSAAHILRVTSEYLKEMAA